MAVPVLLIAISGSYYIAELDLPVFTPFEDITTSAVILSGWLIVSLYILVRNRILAGWPSRPVAQQITSDAFPLYLLLAFVALLEVAFFLISGKLQGSEWSAGAGQAFSQSFVAVLVASFNNACRAMVFGAIAWFAGAGIITKKKAAIIGLSISVFDTLLTFNRVTFAYYAISMFIVYRQHWKLLIVAAIPLVPIMSFLSKLFAAIRGITTIYGYSVQGFTWAIEDALVANNTGNANADSIASSSNGIFETSNLDVLHYIITTVGHSVEPLWGWTLILRPLTIFFPSIIWEGKPVTYGLILGDQQLSVPGLALNSTLLGEPYGNFYYLWPIALVAVIAFYDWLFAKLATQNRYVSSMAFMAGFAVCRFEVTFLSTCLLALVVFLVGTKVLAHLLGRVPVTALSATPGKRLARRRAG